MLYVYTKREVIPKVLTLVEDNNEFFDEKIGRLRDSLHVRSVLEDIEKAEYLDELRFIDNASNTSYAAELSVSSKAAINVNSRIDYCFDMSECSDEVVPFLIKYAARGNIYVPNSFKIPEFTGQVIYNGKMVNGKDELKEEVARYA